MKVYEPLQNKDPETGLWYREWDSPDGMPIKDEMVLVAPTKNLLFPRWDIEQGVWVEDKDSIIESMKEDNAVAEEQLTFATKALSIFVSNITLSDEEALSVKELYSEWEAGVNYEVDDKRTIKEDGEITLYKCRQKHLSSEQNKPSIHTASIWFRINESNKGTIDDPIPAVQNMEYFKDKYYVEGKNLYLCTRDSINPLTHLPSQLVGNYFKLVEV